MMKKCIFRLTEQKLVEINKVTHTAFRNYEKYQ